MDEDNKPRRKEDQFLQPYNLYCQLLQLPVRMGQLIVTILLLKLVIKALDLLLTVIK